MSRYQDIYPSSPQASSQSIDRTSVSDIFTLEYFEAEPAEMPIKKFDQHHILINFKETPVRVENWRDGEHRDFIFNQNEIVVTPAGVTSGWKWYEKSKVIVVTLEPKNFEDFALKELGLVLSSEQLRNTPQFKDEDIANAAKFIYEAMESKDLGYLVLYESLSRIFLVKLKSMVKRKLKTIAIERALEQINTKLF
ncbi:MAG: hypothetical protein GDA46_07055 [Bdellovibrionales bacterium]|nr:hypothetical protein [Bdellovibrionales bacterium]